jgi:DNA-binding MurR/RpiR family transcriptional regulator
MMMPTDRPPTQERPPETIEELRALAVAIARGEAAISLGAKAQEALGRMLDMVGDTALLSITTLSEALRVNPSTLTRLATALGYPGFPGLQQVLLSASMTAPGAFYSRQATSALRGGASSRAAAMRLCHENQANIDRFIDRLDEAAFDTAVALLVSAPRVVVHGIRQFHAVASFLVYGLRMIRSDVALLDNGSLGVAEGLAALSPGDVLLSTSCAPYSTQVAQVAAVAHRTGLATVALTDRPTSPLVATSRAAILVDHDSSFLSNSIGAFVVAAECLINACAAANPEAARSALRQRDLLIESLRIETI